MMRTALLVTLAILAATLPATAQDKAKPNTLTPKEIADGWILLFDGETTFGWRIDGEAKTENSLLILDGSRNTKAQTTTRFPPHHIQYSFRPASVMNWSSTVRARGG